MGNLIFLPPILVIIIIKMHLFGTRKQNGHICPRGQSPRDKHWIQMVDRAFIDDVEKRVIFSRYFLSGHPHSLQELVPPNCTEIPVTS